MASAETIRLMDNLRTKLAGAIDDTLKLEYFNAIFYMMERANIWQYEMPFTTVEGVTRYGLAPPRGMVMRLLGVKDENDTAQSGWTMKTRGSIVAPSAVTPGRELTAVLILNVMHPLTSEGYPDYPNELLQRWFMTIESGVLALMQRQPNKPWSNLITAKINWQFFTKGIAEAKQECERENVFRGAPWMFPQNFKV